MYLREDTWLSLLQEETFIANNKMRGSKKKEPKNKAKQNKTVEILFTL